ncbi:MAG: hypothetical protein M3O70_00005 [Actinomycetota bacterium]|nr:hypothetical protein [Actinomycetota bacterium]
MIIDHVRDSARELPEVDDPSSVTAMRIWHCKFRSLESLRAYVNLRVLVVASYPDSSLEPIRGLADLRYLRLIHLPVVEDLSPLVGLARLETLRLATLPSWDSSGKTTRVESLKPLASLSALRHLELFGIVPDDGSLAPLERCASLRTVRLSKYPPREVDRFYADTGLDASYAPSRP